MRGKTKKITLSSILSALIVVLICIGSFIDLLDITVAAVCALIVYVSSIEMGGKYPVLVYFVSSTLSLIVASPTTAALYFICFFGYYPLLRKVLRKLSKWLRKTVCTLIFNIVMALLMLFFKAVFALQNEPFEMYIAMLAAVNVFFVCFDYLMDMFYIIYIKFIRSKINFKF